MAVIVDPEGKIFELHTYGSEKEFEQDVVKNSEYLFGQSSIYINVKKRVSGRSIVTIPDGYVIDITDPEQPKLFVVENEIVKHDPFRHIGIQMLKFVTSFKSAQRAVRDLDCTPETGRNMLEYPTGSPAPKKGRKGSCHEKSANLQSRVQTPGH
jgi:hypothetical protein